MSIEIEKFVAPWLAARDALPIPGCFEASTTVTYGGIELEVECRFRRIKGDRTGERVGQINEYWRIRALGYQAKGWSLLAATENLLEDIQGHVKTLAEILGAKTLPVTEVVDIAAEHRAMDKAAVEFLTDPDNFPVKEESEWVSAHDMAERLDVNVATVEHMADTFKLHRRVRINEDGIVRSYCQHPVPENAP